MKNWLFAAFFVVPFFAFSQGSTGINTYNPSKKAALDIMSYGVQGVLLPRLSEKDTSNINPGLNLNKGLAFYDTNNTKFWYWSGVKWLSYGNNAPNSSTGNNWLLNGNSLTAADTGATGFVYIGTNNLTPLIFATNGQQRMKIARSGNIGIGVTKPTATLHVEGSTSPSILVKNMSEDPNGIGIQVLSDNAVSLSRKGGVFQAMNGSQDNYGISSSASGGARSYGVAGNATGGTKENYGIYATGDGGQYAYGIYATASNGSVQNLAGYFEGDVYTSGNHQIMGKVGIGIKPGFPNLQINDQTSNTVELQLTTSSLGTTSTDGLRIGLNSGGVYFLEYEPLQMTFGTSAATRMTISAAGNVGIGTVSPTARLHVSSTTSPALRIQDGTEGLDKVLVSDANGNASWDYNKTTVKFSKRVGLNIASTTATSAGSSLGSFLTFTKLNAGTYLEINLNSMAYSGTFAGGAYAVQFEIRIDNVPLNVVGAIATIRQSGNEDFIGLYGVYSGPAGSHTLSVWVKTYPAAGTSAGVILDSGGFSGSISVKETW